MGKYVEGCNMCQRMKNRIEVTVGKLNLTVDSITKLLLVARKDIILVICNRLSKMAYFVTTIRRTSKTIQKQHIEAIQAAEEYCVGQKTTVCSRYDKEVEQYAGD